MKNIGLVKKRNTINWNNRLSYLKRANLFDKAFEENTKRGYPIFKASCKLSTYGNSIYIDYINDKGDKNYFSVELCNLGKFFSKKNIEKIKWVGDEKFECVVLIRANGSNTVAEIYTREEEIKEKYGSGVELFGLKGAIQRAKKGKTKE